MKVLQVNRLVEREKLRRESLESPTVAVLAQWRENVNGEVSLCCDDYDLPGQGNLHYYQ